MTKIIGHRGARGLAAENTIAALAKALAVHVDEVEIDVRVTKDGVPVLVHDKSLRSAGGKMLIRAHTLQELRDTKPDLTTLEEALQFVAKRVPVMIEVKRHVPITPVVAVLQNLLHDSWQPLDFRLGSKSQRTLRALHTALPAIKKVVIEPWSGVRAMWRARAVHTNRIAMKQLFLWTGFVASMHRRGYELYAYTLNDPVKAARWSKRGLAGFITDHPERFTSQR
ncbi:MAG TPA: glycerophosphodiester phosphodiesterase [Candidatus Saccharimonadales bacterium]|nr:glycerophosphodiester phosphodiesterase [Candidatus Saccharimonadales bacterium]